MVSQSLQDRAKRTRPNCSVNPFTATACTISGLKSARTHASRQYIWWSYNKSTFNIEHFDRNPFHVLTWRGKKSFNVFKFGTFMGRFPSDSAASVAVKGLMYCYIWNTFSLNQNGQSFGSPVVSRATLQRWSVPVCGLTEQKERGCRHALQSAVACKRSRSFCQKCRWQVTAKHAYTLCMLWLCMKWHGAWLDGVHRTCAETGTVSCGTSHASAVNPPLPWNLKKKKKKREREKKELVTRVESHASTCSESARESGE